MSAAGLAPQPCTQRRREKASTVKNAINVASISRVRLGLTARSKSKLKLKDFEIHVMLAEAAR